MSRRGFILVALIVLLVAIMFFSNRPDPEPETRPLQEAAAVQIDRVINEG